MPSKKKLGPVKRLGVRYGLTIREKIDKIEVLQKKPQVCPYCRKPKAKRQAVGIYHCKKCNKVFTGGSYFLE